MEAILENQKWLFAITLYSVSEVKWVTQVNIRTIPICMWDKNLLQHRLLEFSHIDGRPHFAKRSIH